MVLYAGSLVPAAVVAHARDDALVIDSADMTLDQLVECMSEAHEAGRSVARVHSGDPSLYGAIGEQIRRLAELGIDHDVTPGVPAYAAAAAAIGQELTLPGVSQTVVLTRTAMRSSVMPERESLETLALSGATLAIHLSARNTRHVEESLIPHYGADCPVVVAVRASWPDERIIRCRLDALHRTVKAERIRRTALILVGPGARRRGLRRQQALRRGALSSAAPEEEAPARGLMRLLHRGLNGSGQRQSDFTLAGPSPSARTTLTEMDSRFRGNDVIPVTVTVISTEFVRAKAGSGNPGVMNPEAHVKPWCETVLSQRNASSAVSTRGPASGSGRLIMITGIRSSRAATSFGYVAPPPLFLLTSSSTPRSRNSVRSDPRANGPRPTISSALASGRGVRGASTSRTRNLIARRWLKTRRSPTPVERNTQPVCETGVFATASAAASGLAASVHRSPSTADQAGLQSCIRGIPSASHACAA